MIKICKNLIQFILLKRKKMGIDASIISNLQNQCKALPEWGRVKIEIVRKISDELAAHMGEVRKYVSQTGCQIIFNKKENKVTIIKPKVSKEDEDLLAGLDDLNTDVDGLDEEMKKTDEEMKKTDEIFLLSKLSLDFNRKLLYILKNYKKIPKKELLIRLDELDKIISNYRVIWDEKERGNIIMWLQTLAKIYKGDVKIEKKIRTIIEKVRKSDLNSQVA